MAKFPYHCVYNGVTACPECDKMMNIRVTLKDCNLSEDMDRKIRVLSFAEIAIANMECFHCGHKEDKEINLKEDKDGNERKSIRDA